MTEYVGLYHVGNEVFVWKDRQLEVPPNLRDAPSYDAYIPDPECPICHELLWTSEYMDHELTGCYRSWYCVKCRIYWESTKVMCPICKHQLTYNGQYVCLDCGTWEVDKLLDALEFGD